MKRKIKIEVELETEELWTILLLINKVELAIRGIFFTSCEITKIDVKEK